MEAARTPGSSKLRLYFLSGMALLLLTFGAVAVFTDGAALTPVTYRLTPFEYRRGILHMLAPASDKGDEAFLKEALNDPAMWRDRLAFRILERHTFTGQYRPSPEILNTLRTLSKTQGAPNIAALQALGASAPQPEAIAILTLELKNPDPSRRADAARTAGRRKLERLSGELQHLAVTDPGPEVREHSTEALGRLGWEHLYPAAMELAESSLYEDRTLAVEAIGRFRTPEASRTLIEVAGEAADDLTAEIALAALKADQARGVKKELQVLAMRRPELRDDVQELLAGK